MNAEQRHTTAGRKKQRVDWRTRITPEARQLHRQKIGEARRQASTDLAPEDCSRWAAETEERWFAASRGLETYLALMKHLSHSTAHRSKE